MPYMVVGGCKMKIDNHTFNSMSQIIQDEIQSSSEEEPKKTSRWNTDGAKTSRWNTDGTYDNKPLDPDYFKKYYLKKLKAPFTCPDCGTTISSKANLSKHRNTKKCINSSSFC